MDDAFLKNDADDTTSGVITAAGYKLNREDSGGDVTIEFQQAGTTSFVMGIDDSDSNVFKIHSHSAIEDSSDLKLDSSGNVTIGANLSIGGTISSGTWGGSAIGVDKGGTGSTQMLVMLELL